MGKGIGLFWDLGVAMQHGITDWKPCDINGILYIECVVHLPEAVVFPEKMFKASFPMVKAYLVENGFPKGTEVHEVEISIPHFLRRKCVTAIKIRFKPSKARKKKPKASGRDGKWEKV